MDRNAEARRLFNRMGRPLLPAGFRLDVDVLDLVSVEPAVPMFPDAETLWIVNAGTFRGFAAVLTFERASAKGRAVVLGVGPRETDPDTHVALVAPPSPETAAFRARESFVRSCETCHGAGKVPLSEYLPGAPDCDIECPECVGSEELEDITESVMSKGGF